MLKVIFHNIGSFMSVLHHRGPASQLKVLDAVSLGGFVSLTRAGAWVLDPLVGNKWWQ